MTGYDREKINDAVADALTMEAAERAAFLDAAQLSETERKEADSLLSIAAAADSILDAPAISFSKDFFETNADPLVGKLIGAFTILGELGHGGMGAVYLASRKVGAREQRVALKLLRREMNTSLLRERFRHEREILAILEHPNIAKLVDFGTTEDGIPYFAMEYIDGKPIDAYCSAHSLGRDERLELFQKVCSAVSAAHRSLVVHRDLKPSNILVTPDGTPKLLDFGISKILETAESEMPAATVTKLGAMTPGYASPEQLRGDSVTTAADIYSLGVILFELLSGRRPFEAQEKDPRLILKAVAETDPPSPSSLATEGPGQERRLPISAEASSEAKTLSTPQRPATADNVGKRRVRAAALRPEEIRGDLDRIVLKSLAKEPDRRYLTVDAFSDDIERLREGRPVLARPATLAYRAERFLRRNRGLAIAAALALVALITGAAATLWQARVARQERARAERRFEDVRALASSFLFEITPQIERLPGSTPAKATLVTKALEYLNKLLPDATDDPALLREIAQAYDKVGDVQGNPTAPNIGDIKGAINSYKMALGIRFELIRNAPSDVALRSGIADDFYMLGKLESFGGSYANATPLLDRSLELRKAIAAEVPTNAEYRRKLAQAITGRGLIPFYDGDNKAAIEYYNKAQAIYRELLDEHPNDKDIAAEYYYLFVNIGEAQGWDGDPEGASINLQKGLDALKVLAEKYPADQGIQRSLNLAYSKRGENFEDLKDFLNAIASFKNALAIARKSSTIDPTNFALKRDVAMAYKKLGQSQEGAKELPESLDSIRNAVAIFAELSKDDPNNAEALYDVANTTFSLGMTLASMKNYPEAIKEFKAAHGEFERVLAINPTYTYARRMSGHNHIYLADALAASKAGKAEAAQHYRSALETFNALKAEGKLEAVDESVIEEIERKLAALGA